MKKHTSTAASPADDGPQPLALTIKGAAHAMSCSAKAVRRWIKSGELKASKKFGKYLILVVEIKRFLAS